MTKPAQSNKFATLESATKLNIAINDRTRFANRLGPLMTQQRKDIRELATVAGCTYEMARRYVVGQGKPAYDRIEKIAGWLGVDPDWLAFGDKNEPSDFTPRRIGIPVFLTSSRSLDGQPESHFEAGLRNERIAVKIDNPLGAETAVGNSRLFKHGDICLIGSGSIGLGDYVLIHSNDPGAVNPHLIRRVEFDDKMNFVFSAVAPGYPRLSNSDYSVVGRVTAVFADL